MECGQFQLVLPLSLSFLLLTPFSLPAISFPESVGGGNWTYFSATCWFYGRNIYDVVQYPIGLVDTDWGGTPVEAWSSPDALAKCGKKTSPRSHIFSVEMLELYNFHCRKTVGKAPSPHDPSVLWNAMIYPFLNMTIKGAVWYQGEANAGKLPPSLSPTILKLWTLTLLR